MEMSSETSQDFLTLQQAAEHLGVHYMTMYRYVRLGLVPARKVSGSWRVSRDDLAEFVAPSQTPTARGQAPWSSRLEARMVAGDLSGAWSVVEAALASGSTPREIYTEVLAPALASIGDRWANGDIGIDEEHLASAIAARVIGRMSSKFNRPGRTKGTVVVAMPPGERHGFGLAMLADVLRGAGYDVLDLGPDTPPKSLVAAMQRTSDVVAVCLSVVYDDAAPGVADMIEQVRSAFDPSVPVIVGGRAIESIEQARTLGADAWGNSVGDIAELVDGIERASRSA